MDGNVILSYELVKSSTTPVFSFLNLDELDPRTDPKSYSITCLSYKEKSFDHDGLIKSELNGTLQNRLEGKPYSELMRELIDTQEKLRKTSFFYRINPFSKGKDRGDKAMTAMYYVPLLSIPFYLIDAFIGLTATTGLSSGYISLAEFDRWNDGWDYRNKKAEIEKKLKDPRTKLFSDLQETVKTLDVNFVHVADAHSYMKKVEEHAESVDLDWNKVNRLLTGHYENYLFLQNLGKN